MCYKPHSNICFYMFHEEYESGSNSCIKQLSCVNFYIEDSMSEPFSKVTTINYEEKYLNI